MFPRRIDNVVIRSGHDITIDAVSDNGVCSLSADDLARSNVGPFAGSGDQTFYQTGDIIVSNGGELTVDEELMLEGYTLIEDGGTLDLSEDLINLGYLDVAPTAVISTPNEPLNLILSGNSVTLIDNTTDVDDDLIIDHTNATLCGDGSVDIGNGGADPALIFSNSATIAQICLNFDITCASSCTGAPDTGTGGFISGNIGPGGVGDQNSNQLWLKANDLSLSDGASVTSWSDVSGNGLTATSSGGGGTEPTFNTNTVNTSLPSMSFDEGDYLDLGQPAGLDFVPGTDSWSFFIVYSMSVATEQGTLFSKADGTGGNRTYQYTIDDSGGAERYFSSFIGGNNTTGTGADVSAVGTWFVSSHINQYNNEGFMD